MKCFVCNKKFDRLSSHLKFKHNLTVKQHYDIYIKKDTEGRCLVCGRTTAFRNRNGGSYLQFCSYFCSNKFRWLDPEYKKKVGQKQSVTKKRLFAEGKLKAPYYYIKDKRQWKINLIKNSPILQKGKKSWITGLTKETDERVAKLAKKIKENHFLKGKTKKEYYGEEKAKELSDNQSKIMHKIIADRKDEWLSHFHTEKRPTKPEIVFINICNKNNFPLKYTGDSSYWVGWMNPDTIESNGKKICVEIFGDYWHNENINKSINSSARYKNRLAMYSKLGWKCLIIWEKELSNEVKVADRIKRFLNANRFS